MDTRLQRIGVASLLILLGVSIYLSASSSGLLSRSLDNSTLLRDALWRRKPMVILRIDDIQDFAFKEGQNYLLNYHASNKIPVNLAVIPAYTGNDEATVQLLEKSILCGAEISAHGWEHEDLSQLDEMAQIQLLTKSRISLERLLGVDVSVMVSPMYEYNNDTISALDETGYSVLSSDVGLGDPCKLDNGVLFIPSTVQLSEEVDEDTWAMKNHDLLMTEVEVSVIQYGYAVIVLHPQEFLIEGHLNPAAVATYEGLVQSLSERFTLTTFRDMLSGL